MNHPAEPCPRMLRFKPPRIAMTLLLCAGGLHLIVPTAWPTLPPLPLAAAIIGSLGFGIMLRAWWLFRSHATAICPTARTSALITGDVYGLTRNPMYLGIVLMLLGVAMASGGIPFYAAGLLFFLIIDTVFCPYEENKLDATFGARYRRYSAATRRWL